MKTTKYTNKELVEIYKNLKTSAKILGFASASDCEMMVAIELEAVKRHLNLVDGTVEEAAEMQKEVTKMKEYSVRYLSMKTLTSVCENGKTVKYTYEEAVEKAKELNARADVSYCKIYKGRTLIETVEKTVEETAERQTAEQETVEGISKTETTTEMDDSGKDANNTDFQQQLYNAEYNKTFTVQGGIERFLKLAKEFVKSKSSEMSLIVDTAAQVLHDKYGLDYGTIETLEIEAYNS